MRRFGMLAAVFTLMLSRAVLADPAGVDTALLPIKDGTPHILEELFQGGATAKTLSAYQRSETDTSVVSPAGFFRVHYDTTGFNAPPPADLNLNGIPDFVDSAAVYLDYAYHMQVDILGYLPPLPDDGRGGGDEVDVYMRNRGNVYGYSFPESYWEDSSSAYIEIENDFAESVFATHGYEALRVTTAHEVFHTIHFRYFNDRTMNLIWWMEQSAVWMEERIWGDVNDYLAYLGTFFTAQQTPLTSTTGNFKYGAGIWPMFLAKRYGDGIIRDIWTEIADTRDTGIAPFDTVIPDGLDRALAEFAVWNYFTEDRANPVDFYPDAALFPVTITPDRVLTAFPAGDSLWINPLTSRYVDLVFSGNWDVDDEIRIETNPISLVSSINSLVLYNNPYDYEVTVFDSTAVEKPLTQPWSRGVLITTNTEHEGDKRLFTFDVRLDQGGGKPPVTAFAVDHVYPNPFNAATTITVRLPADGEVIIEAFNILGQKAATVYSGSMSAGETLVMWKPEGLASGSYFIKVRTPWGVRTERTMYLR